MTKKIYHITAEDAVGEYDELYERIGEADFFVTEDGMSIVTWWSNNDANWRPEYMRDLLKFFDGEVVSAWDLPPVVQQVIQVTIIEFIEENF